MEEALADSRLTRSGCARIPEAATGRRFLVIPALAGRARLDLEGRPLAVLGPAWWRRELELPAGGSRLGVRLEQEREDPLAGFLASWGLGPRGLWQGLRLRRAGPASFVGEPRLLWRGGRLEARLRWEGPAGTRLRVEVEDRAWECRAPAAGVVPAFPLAEPPRWSPGQPRQLAGALVLLVDGTPSDRREVRLGHRRLEVRGRRLHLDGRPFRIQGLLHWGHYPDLPGPDPEPARLRTELRAMRARGFNLLKCCLFLPPRRFLRVCDEEGVAVWNEYPLWHCPLRGARVLSGLRECVRHDRDHPSVLLRSLSCENDDRDPTAVRAALAAVREAVPDGLAADHSAWLDLASDSDWHDEHAYLHAGQWPWWIERVRRILARRPARPFLLGETMAFGSGADPGSRRRALDLRRRQAEALRRAFPEAGYVLCGARDVPAAPLGVQDAGGRWKDAVADWAWQRRLARGEAPSSPLPAAVPASLGGGQDLPVVETLDATARSRLSAGEALRHRPGLRHGSWRLREHPLWTAELVLRGPAARAPLREVIEAHALTELLQGRVLASPPPRLARAVLVAALDRHDRGDAEELPLVIAVRSGGGVLVVSALEDRSPLGAALHAALGAAAAAAGGSLPAIAMPPPPRALFLGGPWLLEGPGVAGGRQTVRTGTPAENEGRNVFQGEATFRGSVTLPADWEGPCWLRAEAMGDGWALTVDGVEVLRHGNLHGTWDAGRDRPCDAELGRHLHPGRAQEWCFRVQDHRGPGGLVGPLYLHAGPPEPGLLY